ncbi:MAG TPA: hypothetical protein DDX59_04790 [Lachnospiraceae bacterium]|nr:hypothetical protein [Lachnospiraceae bacterium]HBH70779.1 hypothetical protein [Lachnospiraceae bacterium]
MFRYFWMEGKDIPAGVGFGHFTAKHILMLLLCAVFITVLTLWFKKQPLRRQNTFLKILACLMLAGNLVRDLFLLIIGRMSLGYLPLHLCSFSIFVYLLHAFLPESYNDTVMTLNPANGRYFAVRDPEYSESSGIHQSPFREALGEIGFVLLLPGTVCALLFPDWSSYPILNFMSLHSFLWHAVLSAYPVLLLVSGRIHPTIHHFWYPFAFLLVFVPPVWLFDVLTGYNYLFVLFPPAGTPLAWIYSYMGGAWRLGYALLTSVVILAVYGGIELVRYFK